MGGSVRLFRAKRGPFLLASTRHARGCGSNQAAWNQSDLAGFMEGYLPSDSLMFIGKSGVTYGHEATLKRYMTGYPDASAMGTLTFENLKWISLGDQAGWLMGKWALKKEAQEDAAGMYTLLWRKFEGTWLIVADHSS